MCPPGVDQTERMPERWAILAPTLQQIIRLPDLAWPEGSDPAIGGWWSRHRKTDPFAFCYNNLSFMALQRLLGPISLDKSTNPSLWNRALLARRPSAVPSTLERLPAELIRSIFSYLDPADVVISGLCSQRLWNHAIGFIRETCRHAGIAPWAGTPLLCVGTYLTELPPALKEVEQQVFTDEEAWKREVVTGRGLPAPRRGRRPARQWATRADSTYADAGGDLEGRYLRVFDDARVDSSGVSNEFLMSMKECVRQTAAMEVEDGDELFLRDITTNEFVQMNLVIDSADEKKHTATVAGAPWLTLDVLLMLKMSWTKRHTYDRSPVKDAMRQGAWAGHCFDVVKFCPGTKDRWLDITDECVSMAESWRAAQKMPPSTSRQTRTQQTQTVTAV